MKSFVLAALAAYAAAQVTEAKIDELTTKVEPEEKPAYVPLSLNTKLEEFTLTNMLASADTEDRTAFNDFFEAAKESWMEQWRAQKERLPPVCTKGTECRTRIETRVRGDLLQDWEKRIQKIVDHLQAFGRTANQELSNAYDAAFECDHGCECRYIENQYVFLVAQIEKFEEEIRELESRSATVLESIGNVNDECDFSAQRADWEAQKRALDQQWQEQLDAVAAWDEDGWDMEEAIDQERFIADQGFRYESDIFDTYLDQPAAAE